MRLRRWKHQMGLAQETFARTKGEPKLLLGPLQSRIWTETRFGVSCVLKPCETHCSRGAECCVHCVPSRPKCWRPAKRRKGNPASDPTGRCNLLAPGEAHGPEGRVPAPPPCPNAQCACLERLGARALRTSARPLTRRPPLSPRGPGTPEPWRETARRGCHGETRPGAAAGREAGSALSPRRCLREGRVWLHPCLDAVTPGSPKGALLLPGSELFCRKGACRSPERYALQGGPLSALHTVDPGSIPAAPLVP